MKLVRASLALPLIALLSLAAPVAAVDSWEPVVKDRERQVEIDRSTVIQSDNGAKVAWARIVLSPERAAADGYAAVKALNRFDCYNRSFFTVKRVYLDSRHLVLREESVLDQSPVLAARNSVDERLGRRCAVRVGADCRRWRCRRPHRPRGRGAAKPDARRFRLPRGGRRTPRWRRTQPRGGSGREAREPVLATGRPGGSRAGYERIGRATTSERAGGRDRATTMLARGCARPTVTRPSGNRTRRTGRRADGCDRRIREVIRIRAAQARFGRSLRRLRRVRSFPLALPLRRRANEREDGFDYPIVAAAVTASSGATTAQRPELGPAAAEWKLCADGKQQSPIDVAAASRSISSRRASYRPTHFRITDTGRREGRRRRRHGRRDPRPAYDRAPAVSPSVGRARRRSGVRDDGAFHHRAADGRIAIVASARTREMPHPLVQAVD